MPGAVSTPPGPGTPTGAYLEHAPGPALAPHVECFWSRAAAPADATDSARFHRIIPDGCVDIVLAFGPTRGSDAPRAPARPDLALAVGTMTRPVVVADAASTSYLGARFRPGVAGVVFGIPASEMTDERVDLGAVWRDGDALCDALAAAPDTAGRIRLLSAAIARRLLAAPAAPPAAVTAAVRRIVAARGDVSVGALVEALGVTRQSLARSFARHVGLSPKMLARVVRVRAVVERTRHRGGVDWSSIALDAGYYDQSHLIAEVKELTGLSPGAWAARRA